MPVVDLFPSLRGYVGVNFSTPEESSLEDCDLVYFATPNGVAMKLVPGLLQQGVRVIDLAADFRLKDKGEWKQWYQMDHACPELLETAVYGLPELNRDAIRSAKLIVSIQKLS